MGIISCLDCAFELFELDSFFGFPSECPICGSSRICCIIDLVGLEDLIEDEGEDVDWEKYDFDKMEITASFDFNVLRRPDFDLPNSTTYDIKVEVRGESDVFFVPEWTYSGTPASELNHFFKKEKPKKKLFPILPTLLWSLMLVAYCVFVVWSYMVYDFTYLHYFLMVMGSLSCVSVLLLLVFWIYDIVQDCIALVEKIDPWMHNEHIIYSTFSEFKNYGTEPAIAENHTNEKIWEFKEEDKLN